MVSGLALPLVAILVAARQHLRGRPADGVRVAAFLVVGLPAGAWVDRMRSATVLIVNDLLRAAALGSIPLAHLAGVLTIDQLYVVAGIVVGICTVFFDVAYQSYLPQLVDRDQLVEGNAKLQASESVSQIAGPERRWPADPGDDRAVRGAGRRRELPVVGRLGAVDQCARRGPAARPQPAGERWARGCGSSSATVAAGDRDVHRQLEPVRRLASAVFLVLLARELGLSAGVDRADHVGLGGRRPGRFAGRPPVRRTGRAGTDDLVSVVVWRPRASSRRSCTGTGRSGCSLAQVLMWVGVVVYNVAQVTFRQGLCPPELLGRMNATMRFLVWGTMPLGGLLGGILGSAIGTRRTLLVVAIGFVADLPAGVLLAAAADARAAELRRRSRHLTIRPDARPTPADRRVRRRRRAGRPPR